MQLLVTLTATAVAATGFLYLGPLPTMSVYDAACDGDMAQIRGHITWGGNVDSPAGGSCTALHVAAAGGNAEVVELLLANGADIEAKDTLGRNALSRSVEAGLIDMVRLLLRREADVNAHTLYGWTPLHFAVFNRDADMVATLLAHGADPNARNDDGLKPHGRLGDDEISDLLRKHGATEDRAGHGLPPMTIRRDGVLNP